MVLDYVNLLENNFVRGVTGCIPGLEPGGVGSSPTVLTARFSCNELKKNFYLSITFIFLLLLFFYYFYFSITFIFLLQMRVPQLDLTNCSMQVSVIFSYSWSLFVNFGKSILPQYLRVTSAKRLLWYVMNLLISKIKYQAYLCYKHGLCIFNILSCLLINKQTEFLNSVEIFSELVTSICLSPRKYLFFLLIFIYELISLFKWLFASLAFLMKKYLLYSFSNFFKLIQSILRIRINDIISVKYRVFFWTLLLYLENAGLRLNFSFFRNS